MDSVFEYRTGMDFVKDGVLHRCNNATAVLLESNSDIDELPDIYPPGTTAHTPGYAKMWELDGTLAWVSIV